MRATATRLTDAERAKGIRRVAIPSEGKSVKCRADKSTGDESKANRGIAPKPRYEMMVHFQFFLIPSFKTSLTRRQHARSAIRVSPMSGSS